MIEDFRYRYAPWLLLMGVILLGAGVIADSWALIIAGVLVLLFVVLP